jgi:ferredoxin-NADP reductase
VIDGDATAQHQGATVIGFVVAAVERDQGATETARRRRHVGFPASSHRTYCDVTSPGSSAYEYLICGSARMMDAMEDALIAVGVPFRQVSTERFDMV